MTSGPIQCGRKENSMATIQQLQQDILAQTDALGHSRDPKTILLFLMEELGEVARAYMKETGHKENNDRVAETFRQELGDVAMLILRLAAVTDTDLEAMVRRTMAKLNDSQDTV